MPSALLPFSVLGGSGFSTSLPWDSHSQRSLALLCHLAVPAACAGPPCPPPANTQALLCRSQQEPLTCALHSPVKQVRSCPIPHSPGSGDFPSRPHQGWPWGPLYIFAVVLFRPQIAFQQPKSAVNRVVPSPCILISCSSPSSLVLPALVHWLCDFLHQIVWLYHVRN